jgi:uncharacterized membrane protein
MKTDLPNIPQSRFSSAAGLPIPRAMWLWSLRFCSGTALFAAGYLSWASVTGVAMAGCMALPQFDCSHVLTSRWAYWFLVPVSLLGAVVYAAMLLAAVGIGPKRSFVVRKAASNALIFTAVLAAGSALWFLGLLLFVSEKLCLWCLVTHANGLLAAGLTLWAVFRRPGDAAMPSTSFVALPFATSGCLALAGVAALVLGQLFGPSPLMYRVEKLDQEAGSILPRVSRKVSRWGTTRRRV